MSQKKVDHYKEYKRNRAKILKREKMMRRVEIGAIAAVCLALLIWFGISAVTTVQKNAEAAAAEKAAAPIELNVDGYMDYISGLQVSY